MRWTKEEIGETKAQLERVKALMHALPPGLVRQQLEPAVAATASAVATMEAELWSKGAVGVPTSIRVDCKCLWKGSRQALHRNVALVGNCLTIGQGNRLEEAISVRGVSASAQGIAMVVWDGDAIILRMWLSSAQEALQWALAVDKASQSEDAEDCMTELKKRVTRMQRGVSRRRISEKAFRFLPCFAFLADGRTSTAKWQEWQDQSLERKNTAAKAPVSLKTIIGHVPFFTKGMLSKELRHLGLDGDLLEVGREEFATDMSIGLTGAKVNASRGMVSAWVNETQLFRFWMEGEEEAQRWASALQSAACLFAKRGGEGKAAPTELLLAEHAGLALKAEQASQATKSTDSPDINASERGTGRIRAHKYISPPNATSTQARSPSSKNSKESAALPAAAVGA